jgi:hypothetical protein
LLINWGKMLLIIVGNGTLFRPPMIEWKTPGSSFPGRQFCNQVTLGDIVVFIPKSTGKGATFLGELLTSPKAFQNQGYEGYRPFAQY